MAMQGELWYHFLQWGQRDAHDIMPDIAEGTRASRFRRSGKSRQ